MKPKAIFAWSGGKDSAFALNRILLENEYEMVGLLTTINEDFKRISMHGVRQELLEEQAAAIGLPLLKMYVKEGTNAEYEQKMEALLLLQKALGVKRILFGDIFLEDLRMYRENNLAKVGLKAEFPLWNKNTKQLIADFLDEGFKTITCCVNDAYFNADWVGKEINHEFIQTLPPGVDPCGENGEYHTFCYDGPLFKKTVNFKTGEKVYKPLEIKSSNADKTITSGFWYCDLLPVAGKY